MLWTHRSKQNYQPEIAHVPHCMNARVHAIIISITINIKARLVSTGEIFRMNRFRRIRIKFCLPVKIHFVCGNLR